MLFYVNAPIYLIILLENQVFIPDFPVGKLSPVINKDNFQFVKQTIEESMRRAYEFLMSPYAS